VIALLAADPTKYGGAGPELLEKLEAYEDEDEDEPDAKRADDIVKRTNEWVSKGQLDAAFGATVIHTHTGTTTAVTPVTQAPAPTPLAGPKTKAPRAPKGKGPKR
jgi:hypothetical protein